MATKRLDSIDIFRGMTIIGMILVNNPGSWGAVYSPLRHAEWHGFTPTDLVFPFFMFIMGISIYLSLSKDNFQFSSQLFFRILKRSLKMFVVGLGIYWIGGLIYTFFDFNSQSPMGERMLSALMPFSYIRILGVLQRLAICYFVVSVMVTLIPFRYLIYIASTILVLYGAVLLIGENMDFSENSIIYRIDNLIIGSSHLYSDWVDGKSLKIDPEGLFSTIPSIAHVLLGFFCGKLLKADDNVNKALNLFIFGTILLFVGYLFTYSIPLNKKIWTSTFTLVTCGVGSLVLGLLIWIVDIKNKKKWTPYFKDFGVNPLFLYVLSAVLSMTIDAITIGGTSIKSYCYNFLFSITGNGKFASLLFSFIFINIFWIIAYQLHKRRIFIKL